MADNFENRLRNLEVEPPSSVWNNIASQLQNGDKEAEARISGRLYNLALEPPIAAWQSIQDSLDKPFAERRGRVISLPVRKLAIAAAVTGIITIAVFLFSNRGVSDATETNVATKTSDSKSVATQAEKDQLPVAVIQAPIEDKVLANVEKNIRRGSAALLLKKNNTKPRYASIASFVNSDSDEAPSYASFSIEANPAPKNIAVAAPPIRDRNGNMIMDMKLVSTADGYITVTGPNGEQTKLSKKFYNLLKYLYGGNDNHGFNLEEEEWKSRFAEWRNHCLEKAAFIPAGTNFMDIFELKDLIQNN